ncbi:translocation/assembly module TamB domain-containing protein [Candidatus Entotheonella palauensis]|uniref:translocation/assembly module TamB domain-containing protein n=1 Tax=Candidatus Entotheonella palauensis TaxID=93172 RepID=UPI000B7D3403|nr:translocation/assembly module TamB domain-containing protein [Candidatus Entotheonella palauensis]
MTRKMGKMASYLAIALVVLLLGYVALNAVRVAVIYAVSTQVSKALPGSLEVGALRGSFINSLALHDITLRDAEGGTVGHIPSIRLGYDLSALFRKRLIIKAVDIVEPQFNVKTMADGSLNLNSLFPSTFPEPPGNSERKPFPVTISLERLALREGRATFDLPSLPGIQTIHGLHLHLSGEITPEQLRIAVHRLTARAEPADVTLDNLRGAFVQTAHLYQLDNFVLEMGQTRIAIDGTLPGSGEAINVSVQLQPFDAAAIGRILQDDAFHGLLHGHLTAEGPPEALRIRTQLRAAEGTIALESEIDTASSPIQYRGDLDINHFNIGALIHRDIWQSDLNVHATLNGHGHAIDQLQGQLQMTVEASRVGLIDLRPSRIDLEADRHRIHIRQFDLDTSIAKMTATGALDLAGHSAIAYDLNANLAPLQPFLGVEPMTGKVHLKGQASGTAEALTATGTLRADQIGFQNHQLHALALTYEGAQLTTQPQVAARIDARQLRVAGISVARVAMQASYDRHTRQLHLAANAAQSASRQATLKGMMTWLDRHQEVVLDQLALQLDGRKWQAPEPVRMKLDTGRLSFQHVRLAHDKASITLTGAIDGQALQEINLRVEQFPIASGTWAGNLAVQGPFDSLNLDGHLQAKVLDLPPLDIELAGRLTPQKLDMTSLHVRSPRSALYGHGTLILASQDVTFDLEIPRLHLTEWAPALPAPLLSQLQGKIKLTGRSDAPVLRADLQYAGAAVQADLAAQFTEPQPQYRAKLQIRALNIEPFLPGLQGVAQATLRLEGAGFSPIDSTANLELQLDAPNFSLAPGLSAHLQARLARHSLHLDTLRVRSKPATLEAQGTLAAMREAALRYHLKLGDLASLQDSLGVTVRASGGISGEVQGPLNALRARGTLKLNDWAYTTWQGGSIVASISATHLPQQPQADLRAELSDVYGPGLPESSLRLDGTYSPGNGAFTLNVTKGLYAKTALNGTATWHDALHVVLNRLRVQQQTIAWQNAVPIELSRDQQGVLRLTQLHLRNGEQELQVQGTLKPGGEVTANVQLRRGHVLPHVQLFAPDLDLPDGQLSLDAMVRGPLSQPRIEGDLALTKLRWHQHHLGALKAQATLTGKTLWTDLLWHDQSNDLLSVLGSWSWGKRGALDIKVKAPNTDLARLAPFHRGILQSGGTLNADLHVTGTLLQPEPQGTITLRDGHLQLAATGEPYRDIQAQLALNGRRVTIERFDIGSRSGPLHLTGWMTHKGIAPDQLDISVQAQKFTAIYTPAIQAMITSDIALRGSFRELLVTGNITIPRARMRLDKGLVGGPADVDLNELTVERMYGAGASATSDTSQAQAKTPTLAPLSFLRTDLTIEMPRNVWAQGPGTAIELSGKLRVTKALQKPVVIAGNIETLRGFASFYGKKFVLQEGKITFPGSEDPTPFLDVVTTHEAAGYQVSIQVEGKATQPNLQLSSIPELDQTDIVSLLVVGKTTDRLTNSEQSSLAKQGQAIVGSLVARQLEKTVGKTLGLDTIEVETGETLGAGSVSVGRYVTGSLRRFLRI